MEQFGHFQLTENYDEQYDDIWIPAKAESNDFQSDAMMVSGVKPTEDDWLWQLTTTSSLQPLTDQSRHITDPTYRFPAVAAGHESRSTTSQSFNFDTAVAAIQWPQGGRDGCHHQRPLRTLEHDMSYLACHPRSVPAVQQSNSQTYFWNVTVPSTVQASAGAVADDIDVQPPGSPLLTPLPDVFASTRASYKDPSTNLEDGQAPPQRKAKRSAEDLYTPHWTRNQGTQREGWCGWCCTWFTLRDSTYWYHMHYSHGISQVDGKRLPAPAGFRAFCGSTEWEVKCGRCSRWMTLPPGDRWNTAYFRHTYKCYFKSAVKPGTSDPSSPVRERRSPVRRSISNML